MDYSPSVATILCCDCGTSIAPNPYYRCDLCINKVYDISEVIQREVTILQCKGCERFLDPPSTWMYAELGSKGLLAFCLKRIKGLEKFTLIGSEFLFTEAHSKRLKLAVSIQRQLEEGPKLNQSFVVDFTIGNQFCQDCHRVEAKDFWKAVVQVRQKVQHRRSLFYLEQVLLKNGIANKRSNYKDISTGVDFYFDTDSEARKVVDFISNAIVSRNSVSKKLISHDCKSNIYNNKYSHSIELAPICKDNLVCLTPSQARSMGGISQLCLVLRVAKNILLIDPNTAQTAEVGSLAYYKNPFVPIYFGKNLTKYIVMEKEDAVVHRFSGQGSLSRKHTVADLWVQRVEDLGSEKKAFCRSHLGDILDIGDQVMGYDICSSNINNDEFDKLKEHKIPDVVLVKKYYGSKTLRNRRRRWRIRTLRKAETESTVDKEFEDFLDDLEEDPTLRKNVNIYKDNTPKNEECRPDEEPLEPDVPQISVEEMLEELTLEDEPMDQDQ